MERNSGARLMKWAISTPTPAARKQTMAKCILRHDHSNFAWKPAQKNPRSGHANRGIVRGIIVRGMKGSVFGLFL
jgi:hypothetical protein